MTRDGDDRVYCPQCTLDEQRPEGVPHYSYRSW